MLNDPIIEEIHRTRKKIWQECNENTADFIKMLKEKTEEYKKQGWKVVTKAELENLELAEHK